MNVKTADRVLDVFETFGREIRPLPVSELAKGLSVPAFCAGIGIPSAQWCESVHATVVLKPGMQARTAGREANPYVSVTG